VTPSWPDDPETVAEARANPGVFAKKTLGQVADHTAGGWRRSPRSSVTRPADCWRRSSPTWVCPRRRWRSIPGRFAVCCRCRSQRCEPRARCFETPLIGAVPSLSPWTSSSTAGRTPSTTRRRSGSMRPPRGDAGRGSDADGPVGDRKRIVQAPATEPGGHRDRKGPQPRSLPHHRQRLARWPNGRSRSSSASLGARPKRALPTRRSSSRSRFIVFAPSREAALRH
jgi:hypothetical protein